MLVPDTHEEDVPDKTAAVARRNNTQDIGGYYLVDNDGAEVEEEAVAAKPCMLDGEGSYSCCFEKHREDLAVAGACCAASSKEAVHMIR